MKIIISKSYFEMANANDIKTDKIKTFEGVIEVSENDTYEYEININDRWLTDILIAYISTVKSLVGMIEGAKSMLEALGIKAEQITRAYHEKALKTKAKAEAKA